ncbi:hypothetical protein QZH41_001943 [Actinostola sp. cb2023]|nr:hypothetical protein QZH41_001943 [Actinostola sp. cb2023]
MSKLFHELNHRPQRNLVWGSFYCLQNLVYMDEAWMVFTNDVIERFLSQNETTMLCHPHADQQIAIWLNDIPSRIYFNDGRLHHYPRASHSKMFTNVTNVCDTFLGIHGAYKQQMAFFHRTSNDGKNNSFPQIPDFRSQCPYWGFNWTVMGGPYRFEPKPCVDDPDWSLGNDLWRGAEEAGLGLSDKMS